jgi:hypothetical protein
MNTSLKRKPHDRGRRCVEDVRTHSPGRAREIRTGKPRELTRMAEVHNMAAQRIVIPGVVKNGLVVPQNDTPLPEGAHVYILIGPPEMTPELQAELAQWEQASDEAWAMIDWWEADDR